MKTILIIIISYLTCFSLIAQPTTGTAVFNKRNVTAVVYELPYSEEAVTTGFENKMQSFGKGKKMKSFIQYKSVMIPEISTQPLNIYLGAEKTDRKDDHAILSLLIANEFDRFYTPQDDPEIFTNATQYLNDFSGPAAAASLELQIKAQEDVMAKTEKKLRTLLNDDEDYQKQKQKIEDKIASNQKDIAEQEKELADQKQKLEALTNQRKN